MGDVYRARDPRLGRAVAIKVLTARFEHDARAQARFEREARAVASLSHPNILSLHDIGHEGDVVFVVTELLEGMTLHARLFEDGALPVRRVLDMGQAMAEGLAAAHAQGIVHRDFKPQNIFITRDDRVKILDFGVASLVTPTTPPEAADDGHSDGPLTLDMSSSYTQPGEVVGTAGYLSPEQARGEPVDARSDVFALGCVLYEMVSGKPAFVRGNAVDTLVAVVREEPPYLPEDTPPALADAIFQCLRKNPARRFQSAHDVALCLGMLASAQHPSTGSNPAVPPNEHPEAVERPRRRRWSWLVAALVLAALAGGVVLGWRLRPNTRTAPTLAHLTYTGHDSEPAAAADGKLLAFASDRDGTQRIWLKQVSSGNETPLTDGPDRAPRIAPDGDSILFARVEDQATSLFRVPVLGGAPRRLIANAIAGDFSPDGDRIVFVRWRTDDAGRVHSEVRTTNDKGGDEQQLVRVDNRHLYHPRWSRDGATIALVDTETPEPLLVLVDVASKAVRELRPDGPAGSISAPTWDDRGHLLYAVTGSVIPRHGGSSRVMRHRLDGDHAPETLFWQPSLIEAVERLRPAALVFASRAPSMDLAEVARTGNPTATWRTRGSSTDRQPRYAPDGERLVFSSNRSGNLDLWAVATASGSLRRLTDHPADDWDPAFLADGRILWSSNRTGSYEIWLAEPDGTSPRQVTHDGVLAENPSATADGAWIVYNSRNPQNTGVWKIRPDGSDATLLVPGVTRLPEVAPDGRHVLYLTGIRPGGVTMTVARLDDGTPLPNTVALPPNGGRGRWLPQDTGIAYTAPDDTGRVVIWMVPFPLPPAAEQRPQPLLPLGTDTSIDSFDLAPDGQRVCYARQQVLAELLLADGLDP